MIFIHYIIVQIYLDRNKFLLTINIVLEYLGFKPKAFYMQNRYSNHLNLYQKYKIIIYIYIDINKINQT